MRLPLVVRGRSRTRDRFCDDKSYDVTGIASTFCYPTSEFQRPQLNSDTRIIEGEQSGLDRTRILI